MDHLGGSSIHVVGVGGVDADGRDSRILGGDLIEQRRASPSDDDRVARLVKSQCQSEPDARGGARDEDGVVADVHCRLLVCV